MRASQNESGFLTFLNGGSATINEGSRVKLTAVNTIDVAGATDASIGVAYENIPVGGYGTVKLFSAPGTFLVIASGAITAGTQLYPAASGQVSATGTTALSLVAIESATAAGDKITATQIMKGA